MIPREYKKGQKICSSHYLMHQAKVQKKKSGSELGKLHKDDKPAPAAEAPAADNAN